MSNLVVFLNAVKNSFVKRKTILIINESSSLFTGDYFIIINKLKNNQSMANNSFRRITHLSQVLWPADFMSCFCDGWMSDVWAFNERSLNVKQQSLVSKGFILYGYKITTSMQNTLNTLITGSSRIQWWTKCYKTYKNKLDDMFKHSHYCQIPHIATIL